MSSIEPPQTNIVAVIHQQGGQWACVAGQPLDANRVSILDARVLDSDSELAGWVEQVNAQSVRSIVPSSEVICRTCNLPDSDPDSLEEAIRLQAETQLLGTAPSHRLAVAMLPASTTDAVRTGLILAWPETSPWAAPSLGITPLYTPDVAAIASILGDDRPGNPLVWVDADNRSVAVALCHMQGVQIRALREDLTEANQSDVIRTIVAETALNAELSMERIEDMTANVLSGLNGTLRQLMLPEAVVDRMRDRIDSDDTLDEAWIDRFGIATGALLATTDDLIALTMLQRDLPKVEPGLLESTTSQLSSMRIAIWLMAAAILIVVFAPLAISGIRLGLLKVAHPSLDYMVQQSERQERQYAMYRALQSEAWPMTKLLADVSNSTPEGIKIETIRLGHGEPLKISGTATPPAGSDAARLVTDMKDQLESMGVFNDVTLRWDDMDTYGPRTFSIDAHVARPLHRPRYEEDRDFGSYTLAERLYGREAVAIGKEVLASGAPSMTTPSTPAVDRTPPAQPARPSTPTLPPPSRPTPPVAENPTRPGTTPAMPDGAMAQSPERSEDSDSRRGRRPQGRSSGDGGSRADSDNRGGNSGAAMTGRIPEMLNQQQVDAMTEAEIRQQLVEVSNARKFARNDQELQEKLTEQFNLLLDGLKAKKTP